MQTAKIGLIGLAVMGENLALNFERNGFPIAVWNREQAKVEAFVKKNAGKKVIGCSTMRQLTDSLERPRKILMMVKAGDPVDWTIGLVKPVLEPGDILIDGGNSHFNDTRRREKELVADGIRYFGTGISGGESGALWGPSIMPGGERNAYEEMRPMFEAIAAKVEDGPCVTYIGPDGAGHFVKMVHNGIEYGDMQLIAEAYDLMRRVLKMEAAEMAEVFAEWNRGVLNSFLIEITADILRVKDEETGLPLVDLILDKAGQKGTGLWTSHLALDLLVAIPTIHAAIEMRLLSAMKGQRVQAGKQLTGPATSIDVNRAEFIRSIHDALYASKICSYAQGMALIQAGSNAYNWNIDLAEVSRIWKGGCIIRAQFLDKIKQAYLRRKDLPNLLMDPNFQEWVLEAQMRWRGTVSVAQNLGIPIAALSASLAYFDAYRTADLPLNLTQAQRDYFGSHLYERTDKPQLGLIHTDWIK
ncbi:NADP-dependent phosphogluconate dehydrogenase [bacterium]|nr:NADP-dependent phosphogluconate dehydrogenase [bacterium]MCI0603641.1 NADP-dependent phosphogluconate dehydrogenase [bacterium]